MVSSALRWAREEFGTADLGDVRRERRLVQLAAGALRRPGGTIARTYPNSAMREAAFRFFENEDVPVEAIGEGSWSATARRCAELRNIVVALDNTSLCLPDRAGRRGFGPVGSYHRMTKGVLAMNALAFDRSGCVLGLLDQQFWVRQFGRIRRPKGGSKSDTRPVEQRESHAWVRALTACTARIRTHAPESTPWFQLDRDGDCRWVLDLAQTEQLLLTVRVRTDRRLQYPDGRVEHLYKAIDREPVTGHYHLEVPARPDQQRRRARLAVRFFKAPISIWVSKKRRRIIWANVVSAREVRPPKGQKPLHWMLFTTRRVDGLEDALQVVCAYTLRWRVEDFHKAWKSGACDIERSQLQALDHFLRWATVMAAVAARIERIKHLSRTEPERPATDEFSRDEIDAVLLLRKEQTRVPYELGQTPTMAELTHWIADLGGHMGSRSSRPPGTIVLRRGLEQVETAVAVLRMVRKAGQPRSG